MSLAAGILLTAYLLTALAEWLLGELNISHLRHQPLEVPTELAGQVEGETLSRSRSYILNRDRLNQWASLWEHALVLGFTFTGALNIYTAWVRGWGWSFVLSGTAFFLLLAAGSTLLGLPFGWLRTFGVERRHGFSTQTPGLWAADTVKSLLVSSLVLGPPLAGGLWLVQAQPKTWWLWGWLVFALFSVLLLYLSPYVLAPLFNRFTPVADPAVAAEAEAVLARAGIKVGRLFQMDASRRSKHSNAYFTGIGRVKRIVLYDTLLQLLTPAEIAAVLAHEAGHWRRRHVLKRLAGYEAVSLAAFWGASQLVSSGLPARALGLAPGDFCSQVVVLGVLGAVLAFPLAPLFNAWSRRQERDADRFATALTGAPEVLASALVKLSKDNLSNLYPHPWYAWFYYSHPPLLKRLSELRKAL